METDDPNRPALSEAQRAELDRRLDRLMQGQSRIVPWEDLRRELED